MCICVLVSVCVCEQWVAVSSEDSLGLGCSSSCCCCYCCVENVSTSLVKRFHLSSSIKRNNNERNKRNKAESRYSDCHGDYAHAPMLKLRRSLCTARRGLDTSSITAACSSLCVLLLLLLWGYLLVSRSVLELTLFVFVFTCIPLCFTEPAPQFKESERCVREWRERERCHCLLSVYIAISCLSNRGVLSERKPVCYSFYCFFTPHCPTCTLSPSAMSWLSDIAFAFACR